MASGFALSVAQTEHSSTSTMLSTRIRAEVNTPSNNDGKGYPCDQCEYVATKHSSLNRHKKSIHEGVQYPCDQCELSYTKAASLKQHKKTIHDGIRYLCDQCEHVASTLSTLRYHKKTKHGGVRYPCSQCEYAATQYCDLNKHTKLKHSVESSTVIKTKKARVSKYQKSQNKPEHLDTVLIESSNISQVKTGTKEEENITVEIDQDGSF